MARTAIDATRAHDGFAICVVEDIHPRVNFALAGKNCVDSMLIDRESALAMADSFDHVLAGRIGLGVRLSLSAESGRLGAIVDRDPDGILVTIHDAHSEDTYHLSVPDTTIASGKLRRAGRPRWKKWLGLA